MTGCCDFWRHLSQPWYPHARGEGGCSRSDSSAFESLWFGNLVSWYLYPIGIPIIQRHLRLKFSDPFGKVNFNLKYLLWKEKFQLAEFKQSMMMTLWTLGLSKASTIVPGSHRRWHFASTDTTVFCITTKSWGEDEFAWLGFWGHQDVYYSITLGWLWVLSV